MAKTTADSLKIEVWGSDRVAQGAPALVDPSQSTIEKGFVNGIASANDFTWVPNILGGKINHVLQNGVPLWNSTTTYAIGNVANHTNSLWIALASNTNSAPTDVNANWRKLATVDLIPTLNSLLPSQTGNANKVLTTNGTNTSWASIPFATVNFDGTTSANLPSGGNTLTATRASNVVTLVGSEPHGHIIGHRVYIDFASSITDGWFTVASVVSSTSFTVASTGADVLSPVNAILNRRSIRKSLNVSNVVYGTNAGFYIINMTTSAPDINYVINVTGSNDGYPFALIACEMSQETANGGARGANRFAVYTGDGNTDSGINSVITNVTVFS